MTAIQWLIQERNKCGFTTLRDLETAGQIEEKIIKDAIMYSLDEDGHTGDWKIKFANDYYDKLTKKI